MDFETRAVTPFECPYPFWISEGYVGCASSSGAALEVATGTVRSFPCGWSMVSGWDHYVACGGDEDVTVMDLATGDVTHIPVAERVVRFAQQPRILELGYEKTQLWDFDAGKRIGEPYEVPTVSAFASTKDETRQVWIDIDGTGHLLDRRSGLVTDLASDGVPLHALGYDANFFDASGARVAIPLKAGGVRVLDPATVKELFTLTSPKCADHHAVTWSDDGNLLATGGAKGAVCVFDVAKRTLVAAWNVPLHASPFRGPSERERENPGYIVLLAFTPDGRGVVAGEDEPMGPSSCGHGGLYRSATGRALGELGVICGSGYDTRSGGRVVGWEGLTFITKDLRIVPVSRGLGAVSPDGRYAIRDGTTYAAIDDAPPPPALQRADGAFLGSFDPTGTKILGGIGDVPCVWNALTGERIGAFE